MTPKILVIIKRLKGSKTNASHHLEVNNRNMTVVKKKKGYKGIYGRTYSVLHKKKTNMKDLEHETEVEASVINN